MRRAAPVVCETPGGEDDMRADLEFVREALASVEERDRQVVAHHDREQERVEAVEQAAVRAEDVPVSLTRRSRFSIDSNRSPIGATIAMHMPMISASTPGSQSW